MKTSKPVVRKLRCAVYTRKSSEEGLEQEFNELCGILGDEVDQAA